MSDLKTIIDAQLMALESVAEQFHRAGCAAWPAKEIDAAVAGIKSALDQHAAPASVSEELMLEAQDAAVEESRSMWTGYSVAYERGYLAAAKRYAKHAAPASASANEIEKEARRYAERFVPENSDATRFYAEMAYLHAAKRYARPAAAEESTMDPGLWRFVMDTAFDLGPPYSTLSGARLVIRAMLDTIRNAPALAPERERLWREATEYLLAGVGAGHWGNCKWWNSDNDGLDSCTCAYGKSVRTLAALGRNTDGTWREP